MCHAARAGHWDRDVQRHFARIELDNAVGEDNGLGHVMGHENGGELLALPDPAEEMLHLYPRQAIQCAQGFIQRQNVRLADQRTRQSHPLPVTTRQN